MLSPGGEWLADLVGGPWQLLVAGVIFAAVVWALGVIE